VEETDAGESAEKRWGGGWLSSLPRIPSPPRPFGPQFLTL